MKVYRVMSENEYINWKNYGVKGLFLKNGKTKRVVWFATDPGYILSILLRDTYNNLLVSKAYQKVVVFDLSVCFEIRVHFKPENGFLNIGIGAKFIDAIKLKELEAYSSEEFLEKFKHYNVKPLMIYWNRNGECKTLVSKKQVSNIIHNWNPTRPWFMRADLYKLLKSSGGRQCEGVAE